MSDVQVGDMVQVSENGDFDVVYSLAKRDHTTENKFVQIHVDRMKKPIELTGHHLLLVNSQWKQASHVQVGDKVLTVNGESLVVKNGTVCRRGFFAPFTYSGKIMASGVKASVFAGPETLQLGGGWVTGFPLHDILQLSMTGHRIVCHLNFRACQSETHNTAGTSSMVEIPNRFYWWWLNQQFWVGYLTLSVVVAFSGLAVLTEMVLGHYLLFVFTAIVFIKRMSDRKPW